MASSLALSISLLVFSGGCVLILAGLHMLYCTFFHPLCQFPGPFLAKTTSLYKAYFELIRGGDFLNEISRLHSIYGPVVRVGPNELHFSDPRAYFDIYSARAGFLKDSSFYRCFGVDNSTFGAIHHSDAKARKDTISALFSRRAILDLEGLVQAKVDKLVARLKKIPDRQPVNMAMAFRSASMDIITSYSFANCVNALEADCFDHPLLVTIQTTVVFFWFMKNFPFIIPIIQRIPEFIAVRLSHQFSAFLKLRRDVDSEIRKFENDKDLLQDADNVTIYHNLLSPGKNIPAPYLLDEALSLVHAGSDTVGNVCTIGTFHILRNKNVLSKLVEELHGIWPNEESHLPLMILERLPYLNAVIKESLRFSHGFVTPLPRIVGPGPATIAGYSVPAGIIVGISPTFLHNSTKLFRDPEHFNPGRWLEPDARMLEEYLVPFSTGPRMCLGMNLAWSELVTIFSNVFRKVDMEIWDTTEKDFNQFKDYFVPIYQGKAFHALIRKRDEKY